ncbi:hypothetical protein M413DRAFT_24085 [Hebeloma cylindrosporum]|uniref:Uncharacterized protein n=1 Tax=Hebeloma cylindrosporum TaxID=76867 RepID=A0A0C2YZE3_HEBCY|nr:hypothetical protein M413DRAFT_24085 [Hebeloma cylindrosporum h7]
MKRPGPLQELPLDRFLLSNPNLSASAIESNKRPLSPGGPTLFSPAKRRILNEEGIFSPEKSWKGPLPCSKGLLASPARFHDVLAGPASPARVLDFGSPKNATGDPQKRPNLSAAALDATSSRITTSTQDLAPSPELKPRITRQARVLHPLEHGGVPLDDIPPVRLRPIPSFIPRELPPQPDPCSIHYPGFEVFRDAHIIVFSFEDNEPPLKKLEVDHDATKENIIPQRNRPKVTMTPSSADLKSRVNDQDSTPSSVKKVNLMNSTHKGVMLSGVNFSTTPKRRAMNGKQKATPHASTPQADKRALRQSMMDEVDCGEGQIDD